MSDEPQHSELAIQHCRDTGAKITGRAEGTYAEVDAPAVSCENSWLG
jgi:hypothetical protein